MIRLFATLYCGVLLFGCARETQAPIAGDADAGRRALEKYECGVCHVIPGVRGARGTVGPSLAEYRRGPYLAGKFSKAPEPLVDWIVDAPALAPSTAMPSMGVTRSEARDIAAYLYAID